MTYPATSANLVILWGRWYDHLTRTGRTGSTIVATPKLAPGQSGGQNLPNLIDAVDETEIKTAVWRTAPLVTGLWALPLLPNDDAQLGAFGGWEIAAGQESPFIVEILEATPTAALTQEMVNAITRACELTSAASLGLTVGQQVQQVWVRDAAVLSAPAPTPPTGYLNSAQVVNLIAGTVDGLRQVPSGGTTGQVVTKSASGYAWADPTGGGGGAPSGGAGGVLGGSYPNPSFAVDMATQAELDTGLAGKAAKAANLSDLASASTARTNLGLSAVAASGSAADLTSGLLDEARIPASIARDSETQAAIDALIGGAPGTRDTLKEISDALSADEGALAALTTTVAGKAPQLTQRSPAATANTTAVANEIVPLDTSGGTITLTGPTGGGVFGARWKSGTAAPTVAAPSGYTIAGAASISMALAPGGSTGELVTWAAFGTDYQPIGGFKPQSALDRRFRQQLAPPSGDTTGAADKTVIQAALDAAATTGTGVVTLAPGGQYTAAGLVIDTGVVLDLNGGGITAPNAANDSVVRTKDYATLITGDTTNGPRDFAVIGGYLDGNRDNQTAIDKPVLAIYGRRYVLDNLIIRGGKGTGLHTRWSTSSPFATPNGFEAFVTRLYVHSCSGHGINFEGPHDAYFQNFFVVKCGDTSSTVPLNLPDPSGRANGSNFDKFHIYGGNGYSYGLVVNTAGTKFTNFVIEGSQTAQALIQASQVQFDAAHLYTGGIQTAAAKGIQIGDSTHTGVNGLALRVKVENCGGGAFDFTYMGDHNWIEGHVYYYTTSPAPALAALGWVGVPSSPNRIQLYVADNTFTPTTQSLNQQVGPIKARRTASGDSRDMLNIVDQSNTAMYALDASGRPRSKSGSTPTVAAGSNAGSGATASVSGTDHAGTVTVTTGTSPAAGQIAAVTFNFAFGAAPRAVVITPKDSGGAALQPFVTTAASAFSVRCAAAPAASTSYAFDYIVVGS